MSIGRSGKADNLRKTQEDPRWSCGSWLINEAWIKLVGYNRYFFLKWGSGIIAEACNSECSRLRQVQCHLGYIDPVSKQKIMHRNISINYTVIGGILTKVIALAMYVVIYAYLCFMYRLELLYISYGEVSVSLIFQLSTQRWKNRLQ